jgi:hypothetical protein
MLGVAQPAWATVQIVPPGNDVSGESQLFWAQAWWQWALEIPAANNPLTDTTGADAGVNNSGPVFFLAAFISVNGSGGPDMDTVSRTITVPEGKPVFFPVINSFFVPINGNGTANTSPCPSPLTLTCAINAASFTEFENMAVQLDGTTLLDNSQIETYRQMSTSYFSFDLPGTTVPSENVLGVTGPIAPGANTWTQDGFYITLDDLSVGTHILHFHGEGVSLAGGPISLDVTDTLNVVVPEPFTWAMMLVGFVGLGILGLRSRAWKLAS